MRSSTKKALLAVFISLFAVCMLIFGVLLFTRSDFKKPVDPASPVATLPSDLDMTVTLTTDKQTVSPGDEFTLTFSATTHYSARWHSLTMIATTYDATGAADPDIVDYLTVTSKYVPDEFIAMDYYNTTTLSKTFGGLKYSFNAQGYYVNTSDVPTLQLAVTFKVSEDIQGINRIDFNFIKNAANKVVLYGDTALLNTTCLNGITYSGTSVYIGTQDTAPEGEFSSLEYSVDAGTSWTPIINTGTNFVASGFNTSTYTYTASLNTSAVSADKKIYIRPTMVTGVTASSRTLTPDLSGGATNASYYGTMVVGANSFDLTATSTKDSTTYTFNITLVDDSKSDDYSISSVVIKGDDGNTYFSSAQFNPSTNTYNITVPTGVNALSVEVTTSDGKATVTGDGTHVLSGNNDSFTVYATAEDGSNSGGSASSYTFNVTRTSAPTQSSDYSISSITVTGNDGKTYLANFNPNTYTYDVTVPYDATQAIVNVTTTDPNARVTGSGTHALTVGSNTITVYAAAQDGTNSNGATKYTINVTREKEADTAYLMDIRVNGSTVSGFNPALTNYTVSVPSSIASVSFSATATDSSASVILSQNGAQIAQGQGSASVASISLGAQGSSLNMNVTVNTATGSRIYTVTVVRATDAPRLIYLWVGGFPVYDENGTLINTNNPDPYGLTKDFYVEIDYSVLTLYVEARSSDTTAETQVYTLIGDNGVASGTFIVGDDILAGTLQTDLNIVIRPIKGSGGADVVYYLHIKRKPSPSSNVNADITISNIAEFNNEYRNSYNIYGYYNVAYNVPTLDITVIPEVVDNLTAQGTYQIFYNGILKNDNGKEINGVDLNYGVNIVSIDILASDGLTKRTVGVVVVRGEVGFDWVSILEINSFSNDYDASINEYSYVVSNSVKSLTFNARFVDQSLWYAISGVDSLSVGENTVTIYIYTTGVTYTNSSTAATTTSGPIPVKTITLQIYRESNNLWQILFFSLLALCIIEAFIIIALAISNRNLKSKLDLLLRNPVPVAQPMQRIQPIVQQVPIQQPIVQPIVQQVPVRQQPVYVQKNTKSSATPTVEVRLTGMGENDGVYDAFGKKR